MWKGQLKVGRANIPVKLYAAIEDKGIHFHILESKKLERIKQHMVDPDTGEDVEREEVRKAFEVERGVFVVLEEEELRRLEPKPSRDIEILQFVPPGEINHQWFDRPYYLGPDGNHEEYFALAEALRKRERYGVVRWVMRKKPYIGALQAHDGYLIVMTLRHSEEILPADDLPAPRGPALEAKEVRLAEQLVQTLEGSFEAQDFNDEYRARVLEFIEKKAQGKRPRLQPVRTRRESVNISDQLAKSIESLKREKKKAA